MGERGRDRLHGLAEPATGQGRAALAGVVGDDHREALVPRARPERRLAEPRVAEHGYAARVDVLVRLEVVERARETPSPGRDRPPVARSPGARAPGAEARADARLPSLRVVGLDVAIADRGQRVAAVDDPLERPGAGLGAARGLGRAVVDDAGTVRDPVGGEADAGVRVDRMVAVEAEAEECGDRTRSSVRDVEEKVEAGAAVRRVEPHPDLAPRRAPVEGSRVGLLHCEREARRPLRAPAVHGLLVEAHDLGPPAVAPVGGGGDHAAVLHLQRVGECVGTDARLVVVGLRTLDGGGRRRGQEQEPDHRCAHRRR
jgi:hypothetical protein